MDPIIKNKSSRFKSTCLLITWGIVFTVTAGKVADKFITYYNGPTYMSEKEVLKFCKDVGADTCYLNAISDNNLERTAYCNNKPVQFNITFKLNDKQKQNFEKVVKDINDIFAVVRPENKISLEYNPDYFDTNDKYNVNVSLLETDKAICGEWVPGYRLTNKNGSTFYNAKVRIKSEYLDDYQVVCHEFLHHAANLGDAYNFPELIQPSIMLSNGDPDSLHIHRNDVALIAAKFGDYSTPEKRQNLIDYVNNYEINQPWFTPIKENADKMVNYFLEKQNLTRDQISFDFDGKVLINKNINSSSYINLSSYTINNNIMSYNNATFNIGVDTTNNFNLSFKDSSTNYYLRDVGGMKVANEFKTADMMFINYNNAIYQVNIKNDEVSYNKIGTLKNSEDYTKYQNLKQLLENYANNNSYDEVFNKFFTGIDDMLLSHGCFKNVDDLTLYDENTNNKIEFKNNNVYINSVKSGYTFYKGGVIVPNKDQLYFLLPTNDCTQVKLYQSSIRENDKKLVFENSQTYNLQLKENQNYSDFISSRVADLEL